MRYVDLSILKFTFTVKVHFFSLVLVGGGSKANYKFCNMCYAVHTEQQQ